MSASAQSKPIRVRSSGTIRRKLAGLGYSLVAVNVLSRILAFLAVCLTLLTVTMLLDALFELPLYARRGLLTVSVVLAAVFLVRIVAALFSGRRDEESLALLIEDHNPQFHSRLIAAVQFTKGKASVTEDASRSMVQSLVDDATSQTRGVQLVDVIDWRWIARSVLFLGIIGVLATAGWFVFRGIAPVLWERVFLSETAIPRNTQIVSTSGDLRIGVGDAVKITAVAEGVVPEDGQLRVTFISGRDVDYPLVADPETAGAFAAKIEDVPESFAYEIRLNDAKSGGHEVTAIARPEVDSVEGVQIYPEYTAIPESRHAPGDFHLFPGSQFTLNIKASKPIESATLRLIGLDKETPVKVSESDPSHLVAPFEVPAESLTGFSITLKDRDGMDSREPAVYRVELLGDEPPKVRITYPRRTEELVTAKARFLVAFEATDRFGIGAVSLRYKVNDGEPKAIELDIDEEPKPVTSLKRQYEWALTEIEPPVVEGDILEYWIEAVDLNKVEPGVGESEHLMARVVSAAEKREDLLSRASDYLGSVGAATDDQERLNNDLGKIIREKR